MKGVVEGDGDEGNDGDGDNGGGGVGDGGDDGDGGGERGDGGGVWRWWGVILGVIRMVLLVGW